MSTEPGRPIKGGREDADTPGVPNLARCPSCNAALPQGAPWCSLCLTDLRRPVAAPDVEPVLSAATERDDLPEGFVPVRGRHRRTEAVDGRDVGGGVRLAEAPVAPQVLDPDVIELVSTAPTDEQGQVDPDALSSMLLARLAATESGRGHAPDPSTVPGGKWTIVFGGALSITIVLVILAAIGGALGGHASP